MKNITKWYEVRADGVRVAAFGPVSREASTKAFKLVEDTRLDLYAGKELEIVMVDTNYHPVAEARFHEQVIGSFNFQNKMEVPDFLESLAGLPLTRLEI